MQAYYCVYEVLCRSSSDPTIQGELTFAVEFASEEMAEFYDDSDALLTPNLLNLLLTGWQVCGDVKPLCEPSTEEPAVVDLRVEVQYDDVLIKQAVDNSLYVRRLTVKA